MRMMRLNKSPILHVYAGPNGSGKSFYTQRYDDTPERYINADDIQKELGLTVLEAARERRIGGEGRTSRKELPLPLRRYFPDPTVWNS